MKEYICTSLEQANELAKFLHPKSADMYWQDLGGGVIPTFEIIGNPNEWPKDSITPCWSLDALMKLLPEVVTVFDEETTDDEDGERDYTDYKLNILKENEEWIIFYEEDAHSALDHDWLIDERGEHLIDAAYNAIVELHNKGLL